MDTQIAVTEKDEFGLTPEDVRRLQEYVKTHDAEVYWDYNDSLPDEGIDILLKEGKDALGSWMWDEYLDRHYLYELEIETVKEAFDTLGIDLEDDDNGYVWDIMEKYQLHPAIDLDLKQIIRLSRRTYIGLKLNIEFNGWFGLEWDEETRRALTFFQMNPRTMSDFLGLTPRWPDYPWRNGREIVTPKELATGWINQGYPGTYAVMLDGADLMPDLDKIDFSKPITLRNPRFVIQDFWNGAGSDFFVKDKTVLHPKWVEGLYNDGADSRGVQSTFGFDRDAWQTRIEQ